MKEVRMTVNKLTCIGVIANPSLSVTLSEAKNLIILLRVNSVKVDATHVASLLAMTAFFSRLL